MRDGGSVPPWSYTLYLEVEATVCRVDTLLDLNNLLDTCQPKFPRMQVMWATPSVQQRSRETYSGTSRRVRPISHTTTRSARLSQSQDGISTQIRDHLPSNVMYSMGAIIAPIILNPRYRDGRARLICTSTSTSITAALCLAIAAIASAMRPRPWVCPDGDVDGAFAGYQAQLATVWACLDDGAAEFHTVERGECGLLAWGQRLRVVKGELVDEGVIVVYGDALGFLHAESHDQPHIAYRRTTW